jgi:hypothetical protein
MEWPLFSDSFVPIVHHLAKVFMSEDIITAYSVAVPHKQSQNLPGLDKHIARQRHLHKDRKYLLTTPVSFSFLFSAGVEHTKLEVWDDEGKPTLEEYKGSGK